MKPIMWRGLGVLACVAAVVAVRPVGLLQTVAAQSGGTDGASGAAVSGRPGLAEAPKQVGAGAREQRGGRCAGSRLGPPAPGHREARAESDGRAACTGVRRCRKFRPGVGRARCGVRVARSPSTGFPSIRRGTSGLPAAMKRTVSSSSSPRAESSSCRSAGKGQSKGNADTQNMHGAADVVYYAKTNEIFVADGYFNNRVIVLDADTGRFKRMWGAFGNTPKDPPGGKRPAPVRTAPEPTSSTTCTRCASRMTASFMSRIGRTDEFRSLRRTANTSTRFS